MERKYAFLPGETWPECRGCRIRTDNPCSDAGLSGQESAEAIVPKQYECEGKGRT